MSSPECRDFYQKLIDKLEERSRLEGVMGIMHWDQEVIMPNGATEARSKQMAALAGVVHEKSIDPEFGSLINALNKFEIKEFTDVEQCNVNEAKRAFELEIKIPKVLVQEIAELSSRGHHIWAKARQANNFESFLPTLERLIVLKKKWANYAFPDLDPYDANIDVYERGMRMERITPIFEKLKEKLIPLIKAIGNSRKEIDTKFLEGNFSIDKQKTLGKMISNDIGFDFDKGRMDESVHPFCGGGHPTDVRITTRYRSDNFIESLYGVIHETGHGLYEQGRMLGFHDLPVSEPLTMAIHESQSLFWERMIAQNKMFCDRYIDKFAEIFPEKLNGISSSKLYSAINYCHPSFIRVEADEVTYPMHIILRYEIEKGLFDGTIKIKNLPKIWNDKMEEYLGIIPTSDSLGVLQDVHWSGGAFGYFPSYTLGAMYACQFYEKMMRDFNDNLITIIDGGLGCIKNWLNSNIHQLGRLYSPDDLAMKVTGEALNPDIFINYLENKYSEIYQLN
jgi:carboxypeptidase Taq